VLFGLLVLSGAAPQVAALVAAVPFNASLFIFGATELVGHLPIYSVLLALLAYGSSPVTAPMVRALRGQPAPMYGRSARTVARLGVTQWPPTTTAAGPARRSSRYAGR
jgi:hypothetical protein